MNWLDFKTFTIALALIHDLVKTNTVIKNIPKNKMFYSRNN